MAVIQRVLPATNEAFRAALYAGEIFLLPSSPAARRLVEKALALLEEELGQDGPVRMAQFRRSPDEFFAGIGRLRKLFYDDSHLFELLQAVMTGAGFDPRGHAINPPRLRVSAHRGHENPQAAPVYYAHRDTWYAHPQCLLNWWLPLHDLDEQETFSFFPDFFTCPVDNDSALFDYESWSRDRPGLKIGWQDANAGRTALYPAFHGDLGQCHRLGFSCRAGEILLFSGAHLHQTRPNVTGRIRFSIDFRTVQLQDHESGLGAPNVDNRSTGSALSDYILPRPRTEPCIS